MALLDQKKIPRASIGPGDLCTVGVNARQLLCCLRELRGHQVLIGYPLGQLPGFLQNVLQQFEAVFFKDGVVLPGILGFVAVHDDGQLIQGRFLELGLDGLGDLLGGVGVDVIHAFLDGIERRILIIGDEERDWLIGRLYPS